MKPKKRTRETELTTADKSLLKQLKGKSSPEPVEVESENLSYGQYGTTLSSEVDDAELHLIKDKEYTALRESIKEKVQGIVNGFYVLEKGRLDFLAEQIYTKFANKKTEVGLDDYLTQNILEKREDLIEEFDLEAKVLGKLETHDEGLDKFSLANMLSQLKPDIIGAIHVLLGSKYVVQVEGRSGDYAKFEITETGKNALKEFYKGVLTNETVHNY